MICLAACRGTSSVDRPGFHIDKPARVESLECPVNQSTHDSHVRRCNCHCSALPSASFKTCLTPQILGMAKQQNDGTQRALSFVHKVGDIVGEKYKIVGILGQGGFATTYEAITEDGNQVALKELSLRSMKGWKELDLFEREARTLKALCHPGIPKYIDYFEVDSENDRAFYIVQSIAGGKSLAYLVENGWRVTEKEVKCIAIEVLDILQYLSSLQPPVIHRDVKPENIILDEATGKVQLVDFGAVQNVAAVTLFGSTVVGTFGYMAPEQFQNRATTQSDLYGLGGTILYLLSGRPPFTFSQKRLKIAFQNSIIASPSLQRVVEKLLEPAPEDRFQSAAEAINALREESKDPWNGYDMDEPVYSARAHKLKGTKVVVKRTSSMLVIKIPPLGLSEESLSSGTFALAWNAFLLFWTRSAIAGGAPWFFTLFSLPFWFVGVRLARDSLSNVAISVDMEFNSSSFYIRWNFGNIFQQRIDGKTRDIQCISVVPLQTRNGQLLTSCEILEGTRQHRFGTGLQIVDQNWLVYEIGQFLGLGPPIHGKFLRQNA